MVSCSSHKHCIDNALNEAFAICKSKKLRFTPIRQQVLKLVWKSHTPAKAYDILKTLQRKDPSAKPPTVYRALDFLLEHKFIHKLHRLNAYAGCIHPDTSEPCFFLVCKRCNIVIEENSSNFTDLIQTISDKHQFTTVETTLEIDGICHTCQAA